MMACVESVTAGDYGQVALFLADFPGEKRDVDFWVERLRFWWDRNPAFDGRSHRGWVLRDDRRLTGFIGIVPTAFQLAGEETVVFSATTWRVIVDARAQSLRLLERQLRAARDSVLFATTSRTTTLAVRKAFGFQPLPRRVAGQSVVVLDGTKVLRHRLGARLTSRALTRGLAPVLRIAQAFRRRRSTVPEGIVARELSSADEAFDDLWRRTKPLVPNTNVRGSRWVEWYCFGCRGLPKTLIGAYAGDRLIGYAIWRLSGGEALKKLECLDLWGERASPGLVAALLDTSEQHARERGAHIMVVPHFDVWLGAELRALGLWRLPVRERQDYFRVSPRVAGRITADSSYFVAAQGDNGL